MSEADYKRIFSKNLNYYLRLNNKSQVNLVEDLGFKPSTVSSWCVGDKLPRMDKVQMLADYFGINKSDLIEEKEELTPVQQFQDEIFQKRKLLFDMSANASEDDLNKIITIIDTIIGPND